MCLIAVLVRQLRSPAGQTIPIVPHKHFKHMVSAHFII